MKTNTELIQSLNEVTAYLEGKKTGVRVTVVVPDEVDVLVIRQKFGMTQDEFAERYGFPVGTVRNWEQKRRKPEGAARILLRLIESYPSEVEKILHENIQAGNALT